MNKAEISKEDAKKIASSHKGKSSHVIVTGEGHVFFKEQHSSAKMHAEQNGQAEPHVFEDSELDEVNETKGKKKKANSEDSE